VRPHTDLSPWEAPGTNGPSSLLLLNTVLLILLFVEVVSSACRFLISRSRARCFSSIVLTRCRPLLAFSWYHLLPHFLIQTTNVIPKLDLSNSLVIYKLLMSIKTEIRGPSPRCLFPRKKSFVNFFESHRDPPSPFKIERPCKSRFDPTTESRNALWEGHSLAAVSRYGVASVSRID